MLGFFLRPVDLSSLTLLFVAVLIGWRLLVLRPRTQAVRYLTLFYVAVVLLVLVWLLAATRLDSWHYYAVYSWRVIWALAFVCLFQYIYCAVELDPQGTEAHLVLVISLVAAGGMAAWAAARILKLAPDHQPELNFALPESIFVLATTWALIVVGRQMYRTWRRTKTLALLSQLSGLFVGVLLLFLGGVSAVAHLIAENQGVLDFARVYLVSIAINVIGFNFLIYQDTLNSRVNRVIAASLLLLQTVFTFLGFYITTQFQLVDPGFTSEIMPSTPLISLAAANLTRRQIMHAWTLPIFAFQALISLLAIGLMMLAGSRIRVLDRNFNTLALSNRQSEIITLIAQGLSNQEIANKLHISENTVKYHLKAIYEALNLPDRNALTRWYHQQGKGYAVE